VDRADTGFDTGLSKTAALQLAVTAERSDQNGVGRGLDGGSDEIFLRREDPDIDYLKPFFLQSD